MNQDLPQPSFLPSFLASLIPLFFYSVIIAGIVLWLAPRKGQSQLWALAVLIPCVGPFVLFYFLSLTDKKVLDDIADLKKQIETEKPPLQ